MLSDQVPYGADKFTRHLHGRRRVDKRSLGLCDLLSFGLANCDAGAISAYSILAGVSEYLLDFDLIHVVSVDVRMSCGWVDVKLNIGSLGFN